MKLTVQIMYLNTLLLALAACTSAFPQLKVPKVQKNVARANETTDRLVFCHFMVSLNRTFEYW
jgi:hypothetical protein